ncbi:MerR family transcriptional regulator [Erythrobacter aquimaris]|uniref:MerR family transcriptional regulator n=1 Tax=Qipengyuania aquimaris TaxID=255984 RepID=A0A6I4TGS3_9SPHN|nr:MerR family transcriptional regulator [Qipengyuania aquimaris]MXO95242.1 MerR family transcriptional regulator [Qipengyuania aquimaris]
MAEFDDHKEEGALRTIGEVARATGIKTHVLRYWEQQFPSLKPLKRSGGRRYYRAEDVALVERIDRLVNKEGYTLKGAKSALRGVPDQQAAAQETSVPNPGDAAAIYLPRLKALRNDLRTALEAAG